MEESGQCVCVFTNLFRDAGHNKKTRRLYVKEQATRRLKQKKQFIKKRKK